jgi:hypothetical protein
VNAYTHSHAHRNPEVYRLVVIHNLERLGVAPDGGTGETANIAMMGDEERYKIVRTRSM